MPSMPKTLRTLWSTLLLALLAALLGPAPALAEGGAAAIDPGTASAASPEPAPATASNAAAAAAPSSEEAARASEEAARAPREIVERFHAGLLDIMKRARTLGFEGRVEALEPLMARTFDLPFMASRTVGREWRDLSEAERERWVKLFTRFTTANYAGRFTGFKGERFETVRVEDAARGTQLVLTKIAVPDDEDVELNYRLLETDGQWQVVDVYLNGTVSELAMRRSEYSSLIRNGFDELVAAVESKIEDLEAKGRADG